MKRILLVVAALLAGASQALAQEGQIQPCDEKSPGNCVEVLVRYWENPPAGPCSTRPPVAPARRGAACSSRRATAGRRPSLP